MIKTYYAIGIGEPGEPKWYLGRHQGNHVYSYDMVNAILFETEDEARAKLDGEDYVVLVAEDKDGSLIGMGSGVEYVVLVGEDDDGFLMDLGRIEKPACDPDWEMKQKNI